MSEGPTGPEGPPDASRVRVLIVDDDPLVRSALRLILGADPRIVLVGEACDGVEARTAAASERPDVVLMDVRMPREDGITAAAHLLARPDPPAVIVLTTFDADETVFAAIRAGACGFLLKDTPPEQLLAAVHRVNAGEPMLSPSVTRTVLAAVAFREEDARARTARAMVSSLSERERQVAIAIGEGRTNAEIAAQLYVSVATVKSYVTTLLTKLDAVNRVQIAIRVHDAGLL